MNRQHYLFSASDVAAYIKWAQVCQADELPLMRALWARRKACLLVEPRRHFSSFRDAVYAALRALWAAGYADETGRPEQAVLVADRRVCPTAKTYQCMELFLKFLTLHFILTPRLPYTVLAVSREWPRWGCRPASPATARAVLRAAAELGLSLTQLDGSPCDAASLTAGAPVRAALSPERAKALRSGR